MKNPDFIDPTTFTGISKQELLDMLKEKLTPERFEWLSSLFNEEMELTHEEADLFVKYIGMPSPFDVFEEDRDNLEDIFKIMLLFNKSFFYDFSYIDEHDEKAFYLGYFNLKLRKFFNERLLDEERIKCIPLLFTKTTGKEMFQPWVQKVFRLIKQFCTRNEKFAEAYQSKLTEIQKGSLKERLPLYVDFEADAYRENVLFILLYMEQMHDLEQSSFKMLRKHLAADDVSGELLDLLFIFLLQTDDGLQIPVWNEENYLCRLLLDYEILRNRIGIVDEMFKGHTVSDTIQIISNHLSWRHDNMQLNYDEHEIIYDHSGVKEDLQKINARRKEFSDFLEARLPQPLFSEIPYNYIILLYDWFFNRCLINIGVGDITRCFCFGDNVQEQWPEFFFRYVNTKLQAAISNKNSGQIYDISQLYRGDQGKSFRYVSTNKAGQERSERLYFDTIYAAKFLKEGEDPVRIQKMLQYSELDIEFLFYLFLKKSEGDELNPPLSLDDFIPKYAPMEVFPKIINSRLFQDHYETAYQNMLKDNPGLSQHDDLLERLVRCFVSVAMNNTKVVLKNIENAYNYYCNHLQSSDFFKSEDNYSWEQLYLCILDHICQRHKTEPAMFTMIYELVFKRMFLVPAAFDIIEKYPEVKNIILEHCYKIINESWNLSLDITLSFSQIRPHIAAFIIGRYKGVWSGLKQLLIILRKSRKEWLDAELNENRGSSDNITCNLYKEIRLYIGFFQDSLKELRQDMANGLSEWLKPLPESKRGDLDKRLADFTDIEKERQGFDITYTEPDIIWRYAYTRAIGDLGVNVDGKGHYLHSVLDKVAQEDPSAMVREAAAKVSAELKNLRDGWDGNLHEKKLYLAFWWIEQAVRLNINLPVDKDAALTIRIRLNDIEKNQHGRGTKVENDYEREKRQAREKLMRARFGI